MCARAVVWEELAGERADVSRLPIPKLTQMLHSCLPCALSNALFELLLAFVRQPDYRRALLCCIPACAPNAS
jgi:hypothetical protein